MEKPQVPSPLEQLKQISDDAEAGWGKLIEVLKQATLELVEVTDEEKKLLDESFWSAHVSILERAEVFHPGITQAVFTRFEELGEARQKADEEEFQNVTLPRVKRRAHIRGLLGLPIHHDR